VTTADKLKEIRESAVPDINYNVFMKSHTEYSGDRKMVLLLLDALDVALGALDRQSHPHVESFCKERARDSLAKIEAIMKGGGANG